MRGFTDATVTERAFAKINLFLDITARRPDGFHDIRSVMHSVSLSDTVTVTAEQAQKTEVALTLCGDFGEALPAGDDNLVCRAGRLFAEHLRLPLRLTVTLEKHIPLQAGLAGGSADAAAVLRALNGLLELPLSVGELCALGGRLGSDIPYCIAGGTRLCEGRGEVMTEMTVKRPLHLVICKGDEAVSTPWAYGRLDGLYGNFASTGVGASATDSIRRLQALTSVLETGETERIEPFLYNVFEEAVLPVCPQAAEYRRLLREYGAIGSLMSGSGPSVFGIFQDGETARAVAKGLGKNAFYAESVL